MRIRSLVVAGGLCASLCLPGHATGRSQAQGAGGITGPVEVVQELHHDVSQPLRDMAFEAPQGSGTSVVPLRPFRDGVGVGAPIAAGTDGALQSAAPVPAVAATIIMSVAGVGVGFRNFQVTSAPPDTNGAVGATQYVQWVNQSFAVFDKTTGAVLLGPAAGNSLWRGFGGACEANNNGDPIAQYDKAANRWVMTQFVVSVTPYLQCVAVSKTPDATGAYNRYAFSYGNVQFNDYPKLGVWPDGYYVSYNIFNSGTTFAGAKVCAFDRTKMLVGAAATQQCFQGTPTSTPNGLLPSDVDGQTPPPVGSPAFFLGLDTPGVSTSGNTLNLWKFHVDWVTPANSTFTGPTSIPVTPYSLACPASSRNTCVRQAGTTQQLDSLGDRLMYRLAYRNFGDHETLVVNHSIQVNRRTVGVRWYEIRNPNGTPTVFQQSTFSPNATTRWMGSIAMDKAGDMLLGYSASSARLHPSIRYTGRLATDAINQMEAEATIVQGAGSQDGGLTRWGDYSAMSVDPLDDCTFWYTNEYLKTTGSFNWSTTIAKIKFPTCH